MAVIVAACVTFTVGLLTGSFATIMMIEFIKRTNEKKKQGERDEK